MTRPTPLPPPVGARTPWGRALSGLAMVLPVLMLLAAPPLRAEAPADTALPAPAATAAPRPVVSEILSPEGTRRRSFPGVIAAAVETPLGFQTAGRIATRPAGLGDRVASGAVLATLDQITLAQDVAAARAALSAAEARADLAEQTRTRVRELHRRGVSPEAQLEAAEAGADSATASLRAARADLARAEDAARFGTLRAPADGIITAVLAEPGTNVTPGTPVLQLATDAGREAVIDVPEDVLTLLAPDARFRIIPRAFGMTALTGRLRLIEPEADSGTRSHRLRIALDPAGHAPPRLGTLVTARLERPDTPVLTLPAAAILPTPDGPAVWRVDPDRRATRTAVTLGAPIAGPGADRVVVSGGLAEGDEIVIRGIHSISEGQPLGPRQTAGEDRP
ncbi:efflux RND transporter periplasmic adaptor subunit [Phaeovulum vinaykumarii]|uniref:RND family efflux transporter, MFP subunit n=1 Tax=Phaeovulum vinaykumarii TaxID=407234 RepID=A0A1N7JW60_9RHOB|nr:efflux RND transporter periplasmic adaptor subunit [Phaeovulum vinaykumarii]SIS53578.1 RND family efflux transporter, MFP subunit [Phaeovulum vinaykumarii]SOB91640.1 RND family efflux transporter MFP subunit [Phaeovulum vinaykumarii]